VPGRFWPPIGCLAPAFGPMRVCIEGHFLRCCKANTAESTGQSFAGSSPLIVAFSCSTTFRSYHLGKNENNMMAKKGCGTGTRTQSSTGVGSLQCMHSSSLPVIFNVASQILRRWLLQRSNHLVSSACTAACICTYSVSFYSSLPFPYDRLPRLCTRFLNAWLTLHATCDLLHLCNF
jgi:hypothetical protein